MNVILIQIDEAHSTDWPVYIDAILGIEQPAPQASIEERMARAKQFVQKYNPPFDVYVDKWENSFAQTFRAWPDKFVCCNSDLEIISKSEYHSGNEKEATIIVDYVDLLLELMNKTA